MKKTVYEWETEEIRSLLIGRKVTKVGEDTLLLDNGAVLLFKGNEGCGGCGNGWYTLEELNAVDNIITNVEVLADPAGDGESGDGRYTIFVFAENRQVNLAVFEGSDGNGYYGSGFSIEVTIPNIDQ